MVLHPLLMMTPSTHSGRPRCRAAAGRRAPTPGDAAALAALRRFGSGLERRTSSPPPGVGGKASSEPKTRSLLGLGVTFSGVCVDHVWCGGWRVELYLYYLVLKREVGECF